MTYGIQFSRGVRTLIADQATYLIEEGASEATVLDWTAELYDLLDALRSYPRLYRKAELVSRSKGFDVHRLNHGEYAVFYRVHDDRQVVEVLDFRHGRRRPIGEEVNDDDK